jgi:cytochrome c oxidase subunit II
MRSRFAFFVFLFAMGLVVAFTPLSALPVTTQERTFRIDARQYAYSPSELQVNLGDRVTIELVSSDVVHGLYVDGYDISMEGDPGQSVALSFTANKAGSFRFRCNVTCGAMHPFMIGRLTVGSNQWLVRSIAMAVLAVAGVLVLPKTKSN